LAPQLQAYSATRVRFLRRTIVFLPIMRGMLQCLQKRIFSAFVNLQL
jgi:hypothetical protein